MPSYSSVKSIIVSPHIKVIIDAKKTVSFNETAFQNKANDTYTTPMASSSILACRILGPVLCTDSPPGQPLPLLAYRPHRIRRLPPCLVRERNDFWLFDRLWNQISRTTGRHEVSRFKFFNRFKRRWPSLGLADHTHQARFRQHLSRSAYPYALL